MVNIYLKIIVLSFFILHTRYKPFSQLLLLRGSCSAKFKGHFSIISLELYFFSFSQLLKLTMLYHKCCFHVYKLLKYNCHVKFLYKFLW